MPDEYLRDTAPASAPPPGGGGPRPHLDHLDGIRALAALWVVADHAFTPLAPALGRHGVPGVAYRWLFYGHTAVDVFLVLSGFCLALPVARRGELPGGALAFFGRRARRILPPYYAALLLCLALVPLLNALHPNAYALTAASLTVPGLLLQDLLGGFYASLNIPTWTVAVEWRIYFLFPVMAWLWLRFPPGVLLGLAAALAGGITWYCMAAYPHADLSHTCPWYVLLFALGVCAGGAAARAGAGSAGAGAGSAAAVTAAALLLVGADVASRLAHRHTMPVTDAATGAVTAWALIQLARPAPGGAARALRGALSRRPLVFLGTFAYSLYLVHYPLLVLYYYRFCPAVPADAPRLAAQFGTLLLAVIPLIVAFAYGFFLLCERPFLNTRRQETMAETARDAALSPAP